MGHRRLATGIAAVIAATLVGTVASAGAAQAVALPAPVAQPAAVAETPVAGTRSAPIAAAPTPAPRPARQSRDQRSAAPRRVVIDSYTVAIGSQRAVDSCRLVLYWEQPLWLAAHNYCGYQWLASVPTGSTIVIRAGRAAGTYRVTGHARINRQSGSLPRFAADLVLQTCVGSGTGFTLAQRV